MKLLTFMLKKNCLTRVPKKWNRLKLISKFMNGIILRFFPVTFFFGKTYQLAFIFISVYQLSLYSFSFNLILKCSCFIQLDLI